MTNADRIRTMSEKELARFLVSAHDCELHIPFCQNRDGCGDALDRGEDLEEQCLRCMIDWLNKVEELW